LEVDLKAMTAAPGLVVGESPLASPELALVDADLAAQLRRSLDPVEHTWLRPRATLEGAPAAIEKAPVQLEFADERRREQAGDAQHFRDFGHSAEVIEQTPTQSELPRAHYPLLPPLEPDERAIEETEGALRRIRERPTNESLAQRLEVDIEF
jgi:hypothetical protein